MSFSLLDRIEDKLFNHRKWVVVLFAGITALLCYPASQLRIVAGFQKHLPLRHPFIETFLRHHQDLGGADSLLVAVRAKEGDIFTPHFFEVLQAVTDELFLMPGVDRSTVRSVFTPNVRFVEIVEGGFVGGNVIPADFRSTDDGLARVRENILKAKLVGRLVANDFTAAMISAQLVESDAVTGRPLDYLRIAADLENRIRGRFSKGNIDIHVIGFAKLVGDMADGAFGVVGFFAVAFVMTAVLVYLFTHSFFLTLLPLLCSIAAVIWTLGIMALAGFGLDLIWILVPFLIFAIGVSHGVQMINAFGAEVYDGADGLTASKIAVRRLLVPGALALGSDLMGFLTLLFIDIGIIRELALTASLGVMIIVFTNLFLLPVLLSFVRLGDDFRGRLLRSAARKVALWKFLARSTEPKVAMASIAGALILLAFALLEARQVKFGDTHAGAPELRPDSRYNRDAITISEKFSIGVDLLTIFVETAAESCIDYSVMAGIDRFQWTLANIPGVRSTVSMPQVAKVINEGWNEGNPKWRVLPRNPQTLAQAIAPIETGTGLLNHDCSVMPVRVFLQDHKAETIDRVIEKVKSFSSENDSQRYAARLAGGNAGIMAATNEVVRQAQVRMLLWIYSAMMALCWLCFHSWRDTLCIVVPLALVSVLGYALMSLLEIGLKPSTLPVVALGVAIGVDYGIYILSHLKRRLNDGMKLSDAYFQTLRITGNAVLITGLTLAAGVGTWIFSALKFQADMGVLLAFMFLTNMLGALCLLPSLACVLFALSKLLRNS